MLKLYIMAEKTSGKARFFNCIIVAYKARLEVIGEIDVINRVHSEMEFSATLCEAKDAKEAREIATTAALDQFPENEFEIRISVGELSRGKLESLLGLQSQPGSETADEDDIDDSIFDGDIIS
jgi:hypothetical protein